MSESVTEEAVEAPEETQEQETPAEESQEPQEDDRDDAAWDPERAKQKIRKVNSENKALRERATKAEQKAQTAEDLQRTNGDLSRTNMQLDVGYDLGLPKSLALRLKGSTREEMLEDAAALVELVAPTKRPPSNRPAEQLRGGGEPTREPEEVDVRKIGERMFRN